MSARVRNEIMDIPNRDEIEYIKLVERAATVLVNHPKMGDYYARSNRQTLRFTVKFRKILVAVGKNRKSLIRDAEIASELFTTEDRDHSFQHKLDYERQFLEKRGGALWFRQKQADDLRFRVLWTQYRMIDNIKITNVCS